MAKFLLTPSLKVMLGSPNAKLNIFDVMEKKKVLFVNLAKGGKESGDLKTNQSIRAVPIHAQSKRCHASHQRWRRRAAFENTMDNLDHRRDPYSGHCETLEETCDRACAFRPFNSDKRESEDSSVFEEVASIRQKGGWTDPQTRASFDEQHGEVENRAYDQRGFVRRIEAFRLFVHAVKTIRPEHVFVKDNSSTLIHSVGA
jgi:hypothetical protein